jgi:exopolysaccharide production protein ExoZ
MQKIWTIQYLRALAALAVLMHHLSRGNGDWFPVGAFGVDIFFVISGFIMWVMTATKDRDAGRFAIDRVARIVPTYWCVSVLSAAGAFIRPWVFAIQTPSLQNIVLSLLFIPQISPPVVPQGWTLNVEMFFYAVFAVTMFISRMAQILTLSAMLGAFAVLGLVMHVSVDSNIYFNPRLLEFVGGLWIGEVWLRRAVLNRTFGIAAVLLGVVAAQLAARSSSILIETWIAASLLIVAGALVCEHGFKIPKIALLATAGDASYIIYLIHTPIVQIMKAQQWLAVPLQLIVATLICITAAILSLPIERSTVRYTRLGLSRASDMAFAQFKRRSTPPIVPERDSQ